jgi:PilZ domain
MNLLRASTENQMEQTERRAARRYEIALKLRWKIIRRRRLLETGTGTTMDLSSNGILFMSDQLFPDEGSIELSIAWPVLLHNTLPMQLMVTGRVVRVSGQRVAIRMLQYEFRTARLANGTKV